MSSAEQQDTFVIPASRVESVRKKLERLDRIRAAKRMQAEGLSNGEVAKALGVSPSTVERWSWTHSNPSVEELIERAAVTGAPRADLAGQLSRIHYFLHGYGGFSEHDGEQIYAGWDDLHTAWDRRLLSFGEYRQVCDAMRAVALEVLGRQPCDWRECADHPEHLYVICYGKPAMVKSRDWSAWDLELKEMGSFKPYPISHYVGWTTQHPPVKRLWQHAANSAQLVVTVMPGNAYEESVLKQFGVCPRCHGSLNYFLENPDRLTAYAEPWDRIL